MKKITKTQIGMAAGSVLVLALVIATVSGRVGSLLTGNLTGLNQNLHGSALAKTETVLLTPSNQLRAGLNSVLKAKVSSDKAVQLSKLKIRFDFNDLAYSNVGIVVNGNVSTDKLTINDQITAHATVDDAAVKNKTYILTFEKPVTLEAGINTIEVVLNADAITLNSVLASSLIDMVLVDKGVNLVKEGPLEKTVLKVNYTTQK